MKNLKKILLFPTLIGLLTPIISSCSSSTNDENILYLKVLNAGDYIYLNSPDDGYEEDDLTVQFENWINNKENKEKYFGEGFNREIKVIYDTYDTNETMFNELKTGKSTYDLVCSSDYMIQKLAKSNMIKKIDKSKISNYTTFSSSFLTGEDGKLAKVYIDPNDQSLGTLNDYTVGYMWGTLGLMYDPEFSRISGLSKEEVIEDFSRPNGWDTLWEKSDNYKGVASIKDSMRDTYAMGLVHVFSNEFKEIYKKYAGNYNSEYNDKLSEIFNRNDDETITKVQEALIELKDTIYGFEVDTGKSDIVTGKVGINLCWSGDAVYSMNTAEEYDKYLYFSIPSYCCNIWFDGFTLMNNSNSSTEKENASYAFLDFLSLPINASKNMDYVGYTSFIAGDEVFDYVSEIYTSEEENTYPYDLSYFFKKGEDDANSYVINVDSEQINRQMRAQYPLESDLPHLAIMQDFGATQNDKIVAMWEKVKVNPLPVWVIVVVLVAFFGLLIFLGSYKLIKKYKVAKRKKIRNK